MSDQSKNLAAEIVKQVIDKNIYLSLATADDNPWVAPLYYCSDEQLNFYFISQFDSLHAKHILKNPVVAFAIFDSTAQEGTGTGVQGSGKVQMLKAEQEIKGALEHYHTSFMSCTPSEFVGDKPYRLFKLVPTNLYTQDPDINIDRRMEVPIEEVRK